MTADEAMKHISDRARLRAGEAKNRRHAVVRKLVGLGLTTGILVANPEVAEKVTDTAVETVTGAADRVHKGLFGPGEGEAADTGSEQSAVGGSNAQSIANGGLGQSPEQSVRSESHETYVVQPGDTAWDIARTNTPEGQDVRPGVDAITEQVDGQLMPGDRVQVPKDQDPAQPGFQG